MEAKSRGLLDCSRGVSLPHTSVAPLNSTLKSTNVTHLDHTNMDITTAYAYNIYEQCGVGRTGAAVSVTSADGVGLPAGHRFVRAGGSCWASRLVDLCIDGPQGRPSGDSSTLRHVSRLDSLRDRTMVPQCQCPLQQNKPTLSSSSSLSYPQVTKHNRDNAAVSQQTVTKSSTSVASHAKSDTLKLNIINAVPLSILSTKCSAIGPLRTLLPVFLAWFLLSVCVRPAVGVPPSWEMKPADTSVPEGGEAVIKCQISHNDGSAKFAWLQEKSNFFVENHRWGAQARFTLRPVSIEGVTHGYDLVLKGATRADDADYTCQIKVNGPNDELIASAHLIVLVKPGIPSITKSSSDLTEGDQVTFTCVTSDGNPHPIIRWYRRVDKGTDWEELTGAEYTPAVTKFGQSQSVLGRTMSRSDHKAHMKCTASNSAVINNATPEHTILLNVKYGPIVRITPSDSSGQHLTVIEGLNATLHCEVDSNPYTSPSTRKWTKDGIPISGAVYRSVNRRDSGNYTCIATNVIRTTRAWLQLNVQYGPTVAVTSRGLISNNRLEVSEGSRVSLMCNATGNPRVDSTQWKNTSSNAVLSWTGSYIITGVKPSDAGRYSCFAENVLRPTLDAEQHFEDTKTVDLVVLYPPGKANVTGPGYVLVGHSTVLHCNLREKGVPAATLEWTRLGDPQNRVISTNSELRFTPAEFSDNADYICKPTNTINDGEPGTFRLVVNEEPKWIVGGELESHLTVNVTTPGALMVQCQVRGRPLPAVRWYQDDTPLNDLDGYFSVVTDNVHIDTYSSMVTSTLYWRGHNRELVDRLRRTDTGRYRCEFSNDHGTIRSDMMLKVQYMPVLNVTADKVATDMNQSADLSCSSHSVPRPHFSWYNRSTLLSNNARISMTTEEVSGDFPYKSTLHIDEVTARDLGEYKCVGVNQLGFAEKYIFLTVKTTPDAPSGLQVVSRTWESVELTWKEGFDGGYRPTYYIYYISARHNNTRVKVVPSTNKYNVTGLYPSLTYTFKVFGANQLGGGDYSANISTATNAHPIEPPTEVFYHLVKRTLTFRSPSTNYCVRIEVHNGAQWRPYAQCAPPSGSVKIRQGVAVTDVRIALCLQRRKEICSDMTKALPVKPPPDDLSVETIIIVACVCGTVVLVLLCILIYLCIRRHRARKKDYENDLNAQRATSQATGGNNKKMAGIDNPSLDQTDVVELDDRSRGRTFSNDTSQAQQQPRPNNANYVMFDQQRKAQNGQASNSYGPPMNGGPGNWNRPNGNISPNEPPPDYREVAKDSTAESEYIAMHNKARKRPKSDVADGHDSGYVPDHMREMGGDSGLSTPDPVKPKKVIYEVIV